MRMRVRGRVRMRVRERAGCVEGRGVGELVARRMWHTEAHEAWRAKGQERASGSTWQLPVVDVMKMVSAGDSEQSLSAWPRISVPGPRFFRLMLGSSEN
jgi:hypothetical protein